MSEKARTKDSYPELLEKYNTLINICQIVLTDIHPPIRFLGDVAESLDADTLKAPGSTNRKNLEIVKETSNNLYYLATHVLDWFVHNKLEISLNRENIYLSQAVDTLIRSCEKHIKARNNVLITDLDESIQAYTNPEVSSMIIQNALLNANKYTAHGEIRISAWREGEDSLLSIRDSGIGFDYQEMLNNLNHNSAAISQHIGFRIIHDLALQVGIRYELKSQKGAGTLFTLRFANSSPQKRTANTRVKKEADTHP